jgi:hypothetical protein
MRSADLHLVLQRKPFQPFRLHLSNGRSYDIRHPEMAMITTTTLVIGIPGNDLPEAIYSGLNLVDLLHINIIEPLPIPPSTGTNGANA